MSTPILYPWQQTAWQQLQNLRLRLPHAILLYGPTGIGKTHLATVFAQSLLCEQLHSDGLPCGVCPACHWFEQAAHPDYRVIRPASLEEEEGAVTTNEENPEKGNEKIIKTASKEIRIEQIRQLTGFVNIGTHRAGRRVILVYPVQALNAFAANALLKTLEEPTPQSVFILVAHGLDRVLPTILSRCRKFALAPPLSAEEQRMAKTWLAHNGNLNEAVAACRLAESGGMPLLALNQEMDTQDWIAQLAQPEQINPLRLAEKWQKASLPGLLAATQRWGHDLCRLASGLSPQFYAQPAQQFAYEKRKLSLINLTEWVITLRQRQRLVTHSLNPRLFVEELLLEYLDKVIL